MWKTFKGYSIQQCLLVPLNKLVQKCFTCYDLIAVNRHAFMNKDAFQVRVLCPWTKVPYIYSILGVDCIQQVRGSEMHVAWI